MSVDMQLLKTIEKNMLINLIQISNKYNLTYFLLGGSCLGAVRHKGFIPWDDDIDVGMPREDYDRFLEVAQDELPDNIFLQYSKTDPDYPMNFAKLRNSDTTFIESSIKDFRINHGVYIDIFPLDGYKKTKMRDFKNKLYTLRIAMEYNLYDNEMNYKKRLVKLAIPDYHKARDMRDKLISSVPYEQSEFVTNYCGAWGAKEIMPKEYFGNGIKGKFEGIEVVLPGKYDLYLTQMYGDYMYFPPEYKRIPHHFCEVIDLHKSYKHYIK